MAGGNDKTTKLVGNARGSETVPVPFSLLVTSVDSISFTLHVLPEAWAGTGYWKDIYLISCLLTAQCSR